MHNFRMESGYVGYWVMYQYEKGIGGVLTVGMNGSPLTPDYAIVKWTDTTDKALKNIKYMGFTRYSINSYKSLCNISLI